jgi:hypothetical protein
MISVLLPLSAGAAKDDRYHVWNQKPIETHQDSNPKRWLADFTH